MNTVDYISRADTTHTAYCSARVVPLFQSLLDRLCLIQCTALNTSVDRSDYKRHRAFLQELQRQARNQYLNGKTKQKYEEHSIEVLFKIVLMCWVV